MTILARAVVAVAFVGCASTPTFTYTEGNLGSIRAGDSKERILAIFATTITNEEVTHGMMIRAARRDASGTLIEVGEVLLLNEEDRFKLTPHWFLFENGRLVRWGRPEDWRAVSAEYQIDFTPSAPVFLY
ncbi:MAG: hypothetical protein HYY64_14255 [Candidatus Rokubacteria bacterium]|nr:hypothetical protein [Candidatus Rokubacteria bacterium]